MPTRYTLEQVVTIFESNKCVLLDTEYKNQLQKLNYIGYIVKILVYFMSYQNLFLLKKDLLETIVNNIYIFPQLT